MPPTPERLDTATELAVARTFLARERTMMAWVRTATSMITFGFTIYKFFQLELGSRPAVDTLIGPRGFALLLIATGLGALALAFIEHRHSIRGMRAAYGHVVASSIAGMVAGFVAVVGILAIALVVFRQ